MIIGLRSWIRADRSTTCSPDGVLAKDRTTRADLACRQERHAGHSHREDAARSGQGIGQGVRRRAGAAGGGEARTVLILVIQRSPLRTVRIAYTDGETEG